MIEADDISETYRRISEHIRRTPVIDAAIPGVSRPVALKLEYLQHTASFKPRGAFSNLIGQEIPEAGVTAASGGNHGAAVAFAASRLGAPARIFVPERTPPAKVARIRSYNAELVQDGETYVAALGSCNRFADETGALRVHAFD